MPGTIVIVNETSRSGKRSRRMRLKLVNSSLISGVGYDEDTRTLEIAFTNGTRYEYYRVPRAAYDGLMKAPSHGQYFSAYIREAYPYRKVG